MSKKRVYYRTHTGGGVLAEFAPALFVFTMMGLFPMIDLIGYGCGVATAQFITRTCTARAANSSNYDEALIAAQQEVTALLQTGLAKFANIKSAGGYNNSGMHLFVRATDINTQSVQTFGPDTAVPPPIDTANNIYEYSVTTEFSLRPMVDLSFVPFIGQVPVLGQPSILHFTDHRAAEYPEGLSGFSGAASSGS